MPDDNIRIGLGTAAIGRPQYINLRQETVPAFWNITSGFKKLKKTLLKMDHDQQQLVNVIAKHS